MTHANDNVQLIQGDCLTEMVRLEAGSVDLTVTSPPYDNLRTYNGSLNDWTADKWQSIIAELYRLTKDGGVVVWNVADATANGSETGTSFRQALWAMECGFNLHDTMIYEKSGAGATGSTLCYWQNFEYMFVFSKGRINTFNPIEDRPNSVAPSKKIEDVGHRNPDGSRKPPRLVERKAFGRRFNIWRYGSTKNETGHPAIFPIDLARDHILSWSNPGDTIFDPFLGSGTTLVAAINTGRNAIGIERDPGYFKIASERVRAAQGMSAPTPANDNDPTDLFSQAAA